MLRQETLLKLLDHTPSIVFVKDLAGRYVFVNRQFERYTGLDRDKVLGRTALELWPAHLAQRFLDNDARTLQARAALDFEHDIEVEGERRTFLSTLFPLLNGAGEPHALCGILRDITARKRTEDTLRRAALAVSGSEGGDVFETLVRNLAEILGTDIGFVAQFADERRSHMRVLAYYQDGEIRRPFTYRLEGTPCASVVGRQFRFLGSGARSEFPADDLFAKAGLESYAAYPLNAGDGTPLGLIGACARSPQRNEELTEAILKIFAMRAAAEIERVRAEEALRTSEASYREIFEASEDAIFVHDWDTGAILEVSAKAEALYGYAPAELRRMKVADISAREPAYSQERADALIAQAKTQKSPLRFEWRNRHKDGRLMWHEVTLKAATIAGARRVLAFVRDITERKSVDEAVRASEEQYRSIFNAAADALVLRDADFRIVDVNPAYEAMSGYSREEVIGTDRVVANPPEMDEPIKRLHRRALAGEPVVLETVRVTKSGTRANVELRGVPVQHRGKPHVLYMGRDITARKIAERALRASEEQYRAIFNAAADALVLRDESFRVVDVNPAFCAMTGQRREEVIAAGRTRGGADIDAVLTELHRKALAGEAATAELRRMRDDGRGFDLEVRAVPTQHDGRPHVLFIGRDITARKRAEAERLEMERQLRQGQKMQAIGQLTGGIAHDFNNLLASIMGYVVLAIERHPGGDAKLAGYLENALASCRRARDLIQQMLTFSRGQRSTPRPLALAEAVERSMTLLRSTLPTTIELAVALDREAPPTMLDPVQLDQVLVNLCINARDAMAGSGRIEIAVAGMQMEQAVCASCRQRFSGRFVELAVADDGSGIPSEVLERMFEPFYTTKEVGQGSGMGLATVHGIVHEHAGHICVDTAVGRGTRIGILLPVLAGPRDAALQASAPAAASRKIPLSGRVLVVDDEESVAEFMRELLETWGLAATAVSDPAHARQAFARDPAAFDVVITDYTMPGTTGLALARELLVARPGLPVILYTGHSEGIGRADVDAAGVRALLHKPVEPEALYGLLKTCLH